MKSISDLICFLHFEEVVVKISCFLFSDGLKFSVYFFWLHLLTAFLSDLHFKIIIEAIGRFGVPTFSEYLEEYFQLLRQSESTCTSIVLIMIAFYSY